MANEGRAVVTSDDTGSVVVPTLNAFLTTRANGSGVTHRGRCFVDEAVGARLKDGHNDRVGDVCDAVGTKRLACIIPATTTVEQMRGVGGVVPQFGGAQ